MRPKISEVGSPADVAAALGPARAPGRGIALIGGADGLTDGQRARLERLFERLVTYLERTDTAVVDGGTDTGVMSLIGRLRDHRGATFRLVGVIPVGALHRLTRSRLAITLAPGHSEFLLAPGSEFGDESEVLFAAADHLAGGAAPTVVVNGGALTYDEATTRLAGGHLVVVVVGSGRAADDLAGDPVLRASRRLLALSMDADRLDLAAALHPGRPRSSP